MATPKPRMIVVVLGLKPASIPPLIVRSTAIVNAMTTNKTMFPSPTPPLVQVTADIAALTAAETALRSHTGTSASRDDKKKQLVADMQALHGYVQQLVSADPAQASAIADGASMALRKSTTHKKNALSTKQTVSGSVKLVAKATKGARSNLWQDSTDGGKTWLDLPPTTQANTTVHSLTAGTTVTFRQRALLKTGLQDWSQPISVLVS